MLTPHVTDMSSAFKHTDVTILTTQNWHAASSSSQMMGITDLDRYEAKLQCSKFIKPGGRDGGSTVSRSLRCNSVAQYLDCYNANRACGKFIKPDGKDGGYHRISTLTMRTANSSSQIVGMEGTTSSGFFWKKQALRRLGWRSPRLPYSLVANNPLRMGSIPRFRRAAAHTGRMVRHYRVCLLPAGASI